MKIVWNANTIRWFHNASEYTGAHDRMAQSILEKVPVRDTLCDIGCGAGLVDFILAPHFQQITCVDRDEQVIHSVQQHAESLGLTNLTARCVPGEELTGQWGTVTGLFHGDFPQLEHYLDLARDQLILMTHGTAAGSFGPKHENPKRLCKESMARYLSELGMTYELEEFSVEYGQPFTDLEDARGFVHSYEDPISPEAVEEYLQRNLEKTDDSTFPYYLPNCKHIAVFTVRKKSNLPHGRPGVQTGRAGSADRPAAEDEKRA